ncbi:MAG TPA: cyclic nucleotide-binding domain-containing protein [Candidatus Obscuribacterales bacterium]
MIKRRNAPTSTLESKRAVSANMNMLSTEQRQEIVEFLKEHSIFKVLDIQILEGIAPIFAEVQYGPGQIVFKQGDPADAVYIVRQGSVEVIQGEDPPKILAYVTAGECFGEMALIHETPRTATIRVPESATVVRLPKGALKELRARFPEVTSAIAEIINHRLAGTLPFQAPGLQGNLAFFDLATVIQTVIASRQSGVLILFGRSGKAVAQLVMKEGAISHATFKHLYGERAVLELMTRTDPLDFIFERQDVDKKPVDNKLRMKPPHMLLIEGARRADELPKLINALGWPNSIIVQGEPVQDWKRLGEEAELIGARAWPLMGAECTLDELAQKLPFDRYSIFLVLDEMIKRGHATRSSNERSSEALEKTLQLPKTAALEIVKVRRESRLRPVAEPMNLLHGPTQVVSMVNAINAVTSNLAVVLGKNEVRYILQQALRKAADRNAHLASIKIHPEAVSLDVRYATPEFSASEKTTKSLEQLMRIFIELAAKTQQLVE